MEMGLTLLAQSGLSPKHWVDAFLTAIYLINRLPSPVIHNESPFSKLFNKAPDYTILRTFGCLCYPLLGPYANHKLSFRSKPCILLGYGANQRGYRYFDPQTHKVYLSRNVVFDENQFPTKGMSLSQGSCKVAPNSGTSSVILPNPLPAEFSHYFDVPSATAASPSSEFPFLNHLESITPQGSTSKSSDSPKDDPSSSCSQPPTSSPNTTFSLGPAAPQPPLSPVVPDNRIITRSQTGHLKPKEFCGFKLFHTSKYPMSVTQVVSLPLEPSTFKQAATKPEWIQAMLLEYNAFISNQTWTLCFRPSHHNVVRNKWVFKVKQKPDGNVDRFKACLVAKGFD
jgi:hypothetical protein